jgi:3-hydroxybutyryl-CoA dehydrogenase
MEIQRVGIVGAGTMGAGIAQVCLQSGYQVFLCDANQEVLDKAKGSITTRLQKLNQEDTLSNLHLITQIVDLAFCHVVIEAVPERLDLKKTIFQELAQVCSDETLLLSNTSSISITEIAAGMPHPERILGFHFFNPAPVMPLIEVIIGYQSGQEKTEQAIDFATKLGKKPVKVKDSPGFIVNRVARPYYNEALRIVGDGIASVEQIDRIMTGAGGFKMGPFALQDLIGIDVNFATTQSVYQGFFQESRFKPSRLQQRMVQAGTLGRKTGGGFYEYTN